MGIGLAVTRIIVQLHGGSVNAASAGLGLGSEFAYAFPRKVERMIGSPRAFYFARAYRRRPPTSCISIKTRLRKSR